MAFILFKEKEASKNKSQIRTGNVMGAVLDRQTDHVNNPVVVLDLCITWRSQIFAVSRAVTIATLGESCPFMQ